jgi:hypothetical protein
MGWENKRTVDRILGSQYDIARFRETFNDYLIDNPLGWDNQPRYFYRMSLDFGLFTES